MLTEFKFETEKLREQINVRVREFQLKQIKDNTIRKIDYSEIEVIFMTLHNNCIHRKT